MGGYAAEDGEEKCVHVHTEECYGEPDEATSSQIGEEPTECTHVCSVTDAYGIQPCLPV